MELGVFMMPVHPPHKPLVQTYDEDIELILHADRLGFAEAWIGEHATSAWENILAPDQFIAHVAREATRLRFGTGVYLLPQHHPANVANRVVQLDHLTRGRFIFGIGYGLIQTDLELFACYGDLEDLSRMTLRSLELIQKLWTEEPPFDFQGEFWELNMEMLRPEVGMGHIHKPYQRPHPPIAVPGLGPKSRWIHTAGEKGWIPLSSNFAHARHLVGHAEQYDAGAASVGRTADRSQWRIARDIFVADTPEKARAFALGSMVRAYRDYWMKVFRPPAYANFTAEDATPPEQVTPEYLLENLWVVGDPDQVAQQLRALHRRVGGFGQLLMVAHDWDDAPAWKRSMELLATRVLPQLSDL